MSQSHSYQELYNKCLSENPRETNPNIVPDGNGEVIVLDQESKLGFSSLSEAYLKEPLLSSFVPVVHKYNDPPKYTPTIPNKVPVSKSTTSAPISLPNAPSVGIRKYNIQEKTDEILGVSGSTEQKNKNNDNNSAVEESSNNFYFNVASRVGKALLVGSIPIIVVGSFYCLTRCNTLLEEIRDDLRETRNRTEWIYSSITGAGTIIA